MHCVIEKSLEERFRGFREAVLRGDVDSIRRLACPDERLPEAVGPRPDALRRLLLLRLDTAGLSGGLLKTMAEALPPRYWCPVVLAFSGARDREIARQQLAAAGVPVDDSGRGRFLKQIDMLRVPVPPLDSALDWLCTFEGVVLLGDGSRRITVPPTPAVVLQTTAGPWQAMHRLMMGSWQMPVDAGQLKRSVRAAVIDTGIDAEHPAFEDAVEKRIDLAETGLGPVDPDGHGTHVAGVIAARPPQDRPELSGIAPFASLIDLQVWTPWGLPLDVLLDAVGAAVEERVDVLNMSLGGHEAATGRSILSMAVQRAAQQGIVCCVAAGNDGDNEYRKISTPGDAPDAIMVAATTLEGRRAGFSSMGPSDDPEYTGPKPDVAAPGCGIVSARSQFSLAEAVGPDGRYAVMHGTSVASPMMAGVAALGLAVLHAAGKTVDGIDGVRRFRSALAAGCRDMFSEGADCVGAGMPQIPAFLGNLMCLFDDVTRQVFAVPGLSPPATRPQPVRAEPAGDVPPHAGREPAAVGASSEEARSMDWGCYRDVEQCFVASVRNNILVHARDMVCELTGAESLPVSDDAIALRNEAMVIRTEAIRAGLDIEGRRLPDNSELWLPIGGRAFLGSRPVFHIGAKSVAAWTAFEDLGKMTSGQIARRIADYTTRQRKEAGDTPCVFVLFSPKPWNPEILKSLPSSPRHRFFWCSPTEDGGNGSWFSLENRDVDWHTWNALTPMTDQFRLQWCRDRLLEHADLLLPGGVVALDDVAVRLGLSERVVERLVREIERQGRGPFLLESGSGGKKYIQRAGA